MRITLEQRLNAIEAKLDLLLASQPKKKELPAMQGKKWSLEEDDILMDGFYNDFRAKEVAEALKRSVSGVRARAVRLGLVEERKEFK